MKASNWQESVSKKLRDWMNENGWSAKKVALKLYMNINSFSKRMKGAIPFNVDDICAISRMTGIAPTELLGFDVGDES